ncbi:MAG: methyltransferase family protein [Candidatus Thorarchaeota archaeon]
MLFYIQSAMPVTRAEKHGEKAWDDCKRYRKIATFFVLILLVNMFLWYWIPVPELNWVIHPDPRIPQVIGTILTIPFAIILVKALMDAGKESFEPTQETRLYGGIYNHIRHPQLLGRTPLTIVLTMWLNSLFLLIFACLFLGIFVPTIIHYEEKDLVKRFGESYIQYRKRTGAIFPKFRRSKR